MDEHFSLELPSVLGSHLAIKSLSKDFPGTVHHLTSASDVADLDLGGKGQYLVIIHLKPVTGAKNVEAVISANGKQCCWVCPFFVFLSLFICLLLCFVM